MAFICKAQTRTPFPAVRLGARTAFVNEEIQISNSVSCRPGDTRFGNLELRFDSFQQMAVLPRIRAMTALASQPTVSRTAPPITRILDITARQWNLSGAAPVSASRRVVHTPPAIHHALVLDLAWGWCY